MSGPVSQPAFDALPAAVRDLARGDLAALAGRFDAAGYAAAIPAPGVLTVRGRDGAGARPAVLLSVGVHGDETGPLELVAHLVADLAADLADKLAHTPQALAVDLMLCVGHVDAIAAGKRFIDADLNRMFKRERGDLAGTAEAARADALMAATNAFFDGAGPDRWHLDLHTAIRASRYPRFAIVPQIIAAPARAALIGWLGAAGIEAVINNPASSGTYSWWTAEAHGAAAGTVELGRVGTLGSNDLGQFAAAARAIGSLLRGQAVEGTQAPLVFDTAQVIVKLSEDLRMTVPRDATNFTPLRKGEIIATDGATVYTVGHDEECIVFPNPDVRVGLRAGIMVVKTS
jgi:succinylglutamate desuccinylase